MKAGAVAVLSNRIGEYSSTLVDVSRTGIRLRGARLPFEGEDVLLLTEDVRVWGQAITNKPMTKAMKNTSCFNLTAHPA